MKRIFIMACIFLIGNNLIAQTKKELKEAQKKEAYQSNKNIIESGKYSFKPTSATTEDGRIFNFSNDKISILTNIGNHSLAELQYIGTNKMDKRTDSSSIGRISYQDEKTIYDIKYKEKKKKIIVTFSTKNEDENFNIILTVTGKNQAKLSIYGTRRDPINYSGFISKIE